MAVKLLNEYRKPHEVPPKSTFPELCIHSRNKSCKVSRGQGCDLAEGHWSMEPMGAWGHILLPAGQLFWCFMRSQKSGFLQTIVHV